MARGSAVMGVQNARFAYDKSGNVFRGVSFMLDDARTALVGENGAGKSTLLKCLTGELELDDGHIVRSRASKVGYVPQEIPEGFEALTVREVMERALEKGGGDLHSDSWRIDVMLDEIGMSQETAAGAYAA